MHIREIKNLSDYQQSREASWLTILIWKMLILFHNVGMDFYTSLVIRRGLILLFCRTPYSQRPAVQPPCVRPPEGQRWHPRQIREVAHCWHCSHTTYKSDLKKKHSWLNILGGVPCIIRLEFYCYFRWTSYRCNLLGMSNEYVPEYNFFFSSPPGHIVHYFALRALYPEPGIRPYEIRIRIRI